jgi:hypothetical protein
MALIVIAILALLALIAGVISYALGELFKPTLSLSSAIAEPGAVLTVSASHLPANQVGEIRLQSELYSFSFRANSGGTISELIQIPFDIGIGDHHISLCWSNSCPLQLPLTVVPPGTLTSPTASTSTGRSPSPSPSPQCPFSSAVLSESPDPVLAGQSVLVSGTNFKPGTVNLTYYAGATVFSRTTAIGASNCAFSKSVRTKLLRTGTRADRVIACDSAKRCAIVKFTTRALL